MQARRLTSTLACVLVAGSVTGCGDTRIRIGKPPAFRSDNDTRLIVRAPEAQPTQAALAPAETPIPETPILATPTPIDRSPALGAAAPSAAPIALVPSSAPSEASARAPVPPLAEPRSLPAPEPVAPAPVFTADVALAELGQRHGLRIVARLAPGTVLTGALPAPGGARDADIANLLASLSHPHHSAIAIDATGQPAVLIVAPYPIVGARK